MLEMVPLQKIGKKAAAVPLTTTPLPPFGQPPLSPFIKGEGEGGRGLCVRTGLLRKPADELPNLSMSPYYRDTLLKEASAVPSPPLPSSGGAGVGGGVGVGGVR
jgi:hypothetical protein